MRNYGNRNSYTYGSSAYAYEPAWREEYETNSFNIRVEKTRGLSKKRPVSPLKVFLATFTALAVVVVLLAQYTDITYNQKLINNAKTEIKTLEDEIYNVNVQIAETLDLANVKKIAIGKLGMVTPNDNQVVYVNVPNENYTINY